MGMYSTLMENKLRIEKSEEIEKRYPNLYYLLDGEAVKFYGYWTADVLDLLASLGKDGILEGEIIISCEGEDTVQCIWNNGGFIYCVGKVTFSDFNFIRGRNNKNKSQNNLNGMI